MRPFRRLTFYLPETKQMFLFSNETAHVYTFSPYASFLLDMWRAMRSNKSLLVSDSNLRLCWHLVPV